MILYDTVLHNSHPHVNVPLLQLQHDLGLLCKWMQFNKLTINIHKSKYGSYMCAYKTIGGRGWFI